MRAEDVIASQGRTLFLQGRIDNEEVINKIIVLSAALDVQSDEPIHLVVDSTGGKVGLALRLVDHFKMLRSAVIGIVNGRCDSAALSVLQGCGSRFATEHSQFMCHMVSGSLTVVAGSDEEMLEQFRRFLKGLERDQQWIEEILAAGSGKSVLEIRMLLQQNQVNNHSFTAQEAKALGFIDDVLPPDYKLFLDVDFSAPEEGGEGEV